MSLPAALLGSLCLAAQFGITEKTLEPLYHAPAETRTIRVWGHPSLERLVEEWSSEFSVLNPGIEIKIRLAGSDIAMAGLYTGQADLALLGRTATSSEIQAFEWVYQYPPANMEILTGSFDHAGNAAAVTFMVNSANPLAAITLELLDAAFSEDRLRGGDQAVTTWDQLGLGADWSDRKINLYAFDTDSGTGRYFREAVLLGGRHLHWDRLREFAAGPGTPHATLAEANRAMLKALAGDRYGLAAGVLDTSITGVKALDLAACDVCEPITVTPESVADRRYPLFRVVRAYFNQPPDQPSDPVRAAFLEYILSPAGQAAASASNFFPLEPGFAATQAEMLQ